MARRDIRAGIDIGTGNVRVVIVEWNGEDAHPAIIGTGIAESRGLRHGYIVNFAEATESIKAAIAQAEQMAGVSVKKASVGIGGTRLESQLGIGTTFTSRADNAVTDLDVQKAWEVAHENAKISPNKDILDRVPIYTKLDGDELMGNVVDMHGKRVEVKHLFITCLKEYVETLEEAVQETGIVVDGMFASPIAASYVALDKRQKTAGCVLVNIGAETTSIAVFENSVPISLKVFAIGSVAITNDIALVLRVPLDEAEKIKLGGGLVQYPKKRIDDIIEARLSEIFELVDDHLKKIGRQGLLPAGIVLTGGGASIGFIEEVAKSALRVPSKVFASDFLNNTNHRLNDPHWAVAYGLTLMSKYGTEWDISYGEQHASSFTTRIWDEIKKFLP